MNEKQHDAVARFNRAQARGGEFRTVKVSRDCYELVKAAKEKVDHICNDDVTLSKAVEMACANFIITPDEHFRQ